MKTPKSKKHFHIQHIFKDWSPNKCIYCGAALKKYIPNSTPDESKQFKTKEHLIPKHCSIRIGLKSNLIVLSNCCHQCNSLKSGKSLWEFVYLYNRLSLKKFKRMVTIIYNASKKTHNTLLLELIGSTQITTRILEQCEVASYKNLKKLVSHNLINVENPIEYLEDINKKNEEEFNIIYNEHYKIAQQIKKNMEEEYFAIFSKVTAV